MRVKNKLAWLGEKLTALAASDAPPFGYWVPALGRLLLVYSKIQRSATKPSSDILSEFASVVDKVKAIDAKFNLKIESRTAPLQLKFAPLLKPIEVSPYNTLPEITELQLLPGCLRRSQDSSFFFTLPRGVNVVSSFDRTIVEVPKSFGKLAFINKN